MRVVSGRLRPGSLYGPFSFRRVAIIFVFGLDEAITIRIEQETKALGVNASLKKITAL